VSRPLLLWTGYFTPKHEFWPDRPAFQWQDNPAWAEVRAGFVVCATLVSVLEYFPKMKPGIHPAYEEINVICACGHKFRTRSAHKGDIRVEICSSCHPFFTGKQKLIDTEGRVDRFQKKYQKAREAAAAKKAQPVA
jgi:large subunit ribosomal protein L31